MIGSVAVLRMAMLVQRVNHATHRMVRKGADGAGGPSAALRAMQWHVLSHELERGLAAVAPMLTEQGAASIAVMVGMCRAARDAERDCAPAAIWSKCALDGGR